MNSATQGGWRTRTTFVLALSASAVGLGNLWRFSYLSGEHGGGPFVISYVLCMFLIAVPVMVAEVLLGRHGRADPIGAIRHACDRSLRSRGWKMVGALACLTGLLILPLYAVVAGWGMTYADFMYRGAFSAASAAEVAAHFDGLLSNPLLQAYWASVFLLLTSGIIVLGVRRGLGLFVWLVVPMLIAILTFLIKFGFDNGDLAATQAFLFSTQWADFSPHSVLVALGHAFFTLGVGVATGISYGAYAPSQLPIGRSVLAVAVFDTMIALLAGLAIFPIVFANNMEPATGPGLLFISLPYAFGNTAGGELLGTGFFLFMTLAALGSAVAIMEPIVAAVGRQAGVTRFTATVLVAALVWTLGLAIIASFSTEYEVAWVGKHSLFGLLDRAVATLLLPLVALLVAIFVGWRMRPEILKLELSRDSAVFFSLWHFLLRYIAPPAIVLLLLLPFIRLV